MLADLDLLLTTVFVTADDLLPASRPNARRSLTDAEVVTLLVAQAIMGIPSDRRFVRVARKQLIAWFPGLVGQSGFHKRRARLVDAIELVMAALARECPGFWDDIVLLDSTPVETARSRETVKRAGDSRLDDAIGNAAAYGYCPSHSRWFYGMRLHAAFRPDGTPRAAMLVGADRPEREIALAMLPVALRGGEIVIGDKKLRRPRLRRRRRRARSDTVAARPQKRARHRPAPLDPAPAHRIDLPDLQRPAHARAPRGTNPAQPARPHRPAHARPHRQRLPQPLARPALPRPRRPHRLTSRAESLI
jgi:hypothetical protein